MSSSSVDPLKQLKMHQVAIAELNSLPPSRAVYQKKGNLFFRTTPQKAAALEQKSMDAIMGKKLPPSSSSSSTSST